jgi:hypothetical protein
MPRSNVRRTHDLLSMSDVVWAAAIAGGVGLAGNAFTYLAARANRRLDLATLEAENERFHEERREPERQNRQGTYHRLLAVLDRYDMWATGYASGIDDDTFEATLAEHNYLIGAIHLFGAEEVQQAVGPLIELFAQVGERMAKAPRDGGHPPPGFGTTCRSLRGIAIPFVESVKPHGHRERRTGRTTLGTPSSTD